MKKKYVSIQGFKSKVQLFQPESKNLMKSKFESSTSKVKLIM